MRNPAPPSLFVVATLAVSAACGPERMEAVYLLPGTLQDSMVAHYSFDEVAGNVLHDTSGHNYDGDLVGPIWAPGHFGGALSFQRGDYVLVPGFPDATPSWSVSVWIREPQSDLGYGSVTVLSTEIGLKGGWEINLTDSPGELHYHFGFFTGPGAYEYAAFDCYCMQPDVWRHVVAVVDSPSLSMSVYVDGALEYHGALNRTILPGEPSLYMGRWSGDNRLFAGDLDEVTIYSRTLAPDEVRALYHAPAPELAVR